MHPERQQPSRRSRRDAAPTPEDVLVSRIRRDAQDAAADDAVLSRVRRQWVNRPLFASRQRSASARRVYRRRPTRSVEEALDDLDYLDATAAVLSRRRREWTDVPLFAVKQIEAARVKEENEITHPHHHGERQRQDQRKGQGQGKRQEEEYDRGENRAEYDRELNEYRRVLDEYNRSYNYRYRDYSRYNG